MTGHILRWLFHAITAFLPLTDSLLVSSDCAHRWGWPRPSPQQLAGTVTVNHLFFQAEWPPCHWEGCAIPTASLPNRTGHIVQKPTGLLGIQTIMSLPFGNCFQIDCNRLKSDPDIFAMRWMKFCDIVQYTSSVSPNKTCMNIFVLTVECWS